MDARGDAITSSQGTHLPGDIDMWVFVLGDLVIFSFYFVVFLIYRFHEPRLFLESQRRLNLLIGTANTLVLLTSSRFVALAVQASRANDNQRAVRLIGRAVVCATVFVVVKIVEWNSEISRGFTLPRNDFFMFYFMLTGVHLFHLLLGLLILGVALRHLHGPHSRPESVVVVEAAATYWHMVDVVWVILFALLYVLR